VPHSRIAEVTDHLQRWATAKGLMASAAEYTSATRDRRQLRFTKDARPELEQAWRTHWLAADLPEKQQARIVERQQAAPDLVVVQPVKDWTCAECHNTHDAGSPLIMDNDSPLCMTCADMDHLVFLPSGDAALTRRAKKESRLSAVVVRWSRNRKRYERQGLLVEEAALDEAERQCLDDEDARMRRRERDRVRRAEQDLELQARFAKEITRLYPGCPEERAEAIAAHAVLRGSGRVGRSAAGRNLDEAAVALAVVASVRHENTGYDELLMSGVPRADAREQIRDTIDQVLEGWL
jgi:predicted CXXCH cytochrome family protein